MFRSTHAYPSDRIKYVLDDARVQVLLTQEPLLRIAAGNLRRSRLRRSRTGKHSSMKTADQLARK